MANSITIQIRGDTAANWTSKNPVPKDRELCYDKTNNQLKTGDGTTAWNSLKYTPEIVNGLTSTSANAALSAAQGKALADRITTLENKPSGSSVNVINNLTSTSTTDALSAAQGNALANRVTTLENNPSGGISQGIMQVNGFYTSLGTAKVPDGGTWLVLLFIYDYIEPKLWNHVPVIAVGIVPGGTTLSKTNIKNYLISSAPIATQDFSGSYRDTYVSSLVDNSFSQNFVFLRVK